MRLTGNNIGQTCQFSWILLHPPKTNGKITWKRPLGKGKASTFWGVPAASFSGLHKLFSYCHPQHVSNQFSRLVLLPKSRGGPFWTSLHIPTRGSFHRNLNGYSKLRCLKGKKHVPKHHFWYPCKNVKGPKHCCRVHLFLIHLCQGLKIFIYWKNKFIPPLMTGIHIILVNIPYIEYLGMPIIWPNGIIFHQPRSPWNFWSPISLTKSPPFGGPNRSCFWSLQFDQNYGEKSLNAGNYARHSMYDIFTYIYPQNYPNVGKYTLHWVSGYANYGEKIVLNLDQNGPMGDKQQDCC